MFKRIFTRDGSEFKHKEIIYSKFRGDIIDEGYEGVELITNTHPHNNMYWKGSSELIYCSDRIIIIDERDYKFNIIKNRNTQNKNFVGHYTINSDNIINKLATMFFFLDNNCLNNPGPSRIPYEPIERNDQYEGYFIEAEEFILVNLI